MSKLSNKAKNSKLTADSKKESHDNILRRVEYKEYPRSYRLDVETMNALKNTLDRINETSPKKISESKLIKALIWLSKELDDEKLIKTAKEIW